MKQALPKLISTDMSMQEAPQSLNLPEGSLQYRVKIINVSEAKLRLKLGRFENTFWKR
jgi:hypothetical protein